MPLHHPHPGAEIADQQADRGATTKVGRDPARPRYVDAFTVMRADSMGRTGRRASSKSSMAQPANFSILQLPFMSTTAATSRNATRSNWRTRVSRSHIYGVTMRNTLAHHCAVIRRSVSAQCCSSRMPLKKFRMLSLRRRVLPSHRRDRIPGSRWLRHAMPARAGTWRQARPALPSCRPRTCPDNEAGHRD